MCLCVPCDTNHALALLGQIKALGDWWTWERDNEKRGTLAAQPWKEIYIDLDRQLRECGVFDMACGCDDSPKKTRINDDGLLEVYNPETDMWEVDTSDDVRFNSPTLPPLPGADGNDKKCEAANSIVTAFEDLYNQELDAITDATDLLQVVKTILFGLVALAIGLPVVGVPAFLVLLITTLVTFIISLPPEEFSDAFDEQVWQDFLCILFCEMGDDASFTEQQWEKVRERTLNEMPNVVTQRFFPGHLDLIGSAGLTNLGRTGYGGSRICEECQCGDLNCGFSTNYTMNSDRWSIATELVNPAVFEKPPGLVVNTSGNPVFSALGSQTLAAFTTFEQPCYITDVTMYTQGRSNPGNITVAYKTTLGGSWIDAGTQAYTSWAGGVPKVFEINAPVMAIQIQSEAFNSGQNTIVLVTIGDPTP